MPSAPEGAEVRDHPDWTTRGLIAVRVVALAVVVIGVPHWPDAAAHRYARIVAEGGVPWRDTPVEYAIGDWLVIRAVAWGGLGLTRILLGIVAFGADLVAWAAVVYGWGRSAGRRYLWLGLPLLLFIYRRGDLVSVALAVAGLALAERGHERSGGVSIAAAILTKIWPVVVAPAFALERRWKAVTTGVIALVAGGLAWLAIGGMNIIADVSSFRGAEGWAVASTVGVVVWVRTGTFQFEAGAPRTGTVPGWAPFALGALAVVLVAVVWLLAGRRRQRPAGTPALAAVASLLACAPLLSPEYMAWLLPWAAVAGGRWAKLTSVPIVLTAAYVLLRFLDLSRSPGVDQLLLIARNLAVIAIIVANLGWGRDASDVAAEDALQPHAVA
jgi:glycosyl transferase family 87